MEIFKLFGSILIENDKANQSLDQTDKKGQGLADTFNTGISAAGKWGLAIGVAAAAVAVAIGTVAFNAAKGFEKQMANVATLLDGDVKSKIESLGAQVKTLATGLGTSTDLLTDGLYQVISAFGESEESMRILEVAAKGAAAGNAAVTDSVNLLAAVTKGYGDTSEAAAKKASDLAFMTVKLGQTTFPELASAMGAVIPLASTLKVSQEELFGAMATLTGVTGNTAEVTTQLRATLQGFLQPSADMTKALDDMGYANGMVALESEGLEGMLNKLKDSVNGDEVAFSNFFSSIEAKNAVLALAGSQADNFSVKVQAMGDAAGATEEAFARQQDTIDASMARIEQSLNVVLISIGEKFLPILAKLLDWVLINFPIIQAYAIEVFENKISPAIQFLSEKLKIAYDWFNQYILPAVKALAEYVRDNWPAMQKTAENVLKEITDMASALWKLFEVSLLPILKALFEFIQTNWPAIQATFAVVFGAISKNIETVWKALELVVSWSTKAIEALTKFFTKQSEGQGGGLTGGSFGLGGSLNLGKGSKGMPPGLATGGIITSAGRVLVGERGPEFLDLPRNAKVTPLDKSGINITISGNTIIGDDDPAIQRLGDALVRRLQRAGVSV